MPSRFITERDEAVWNDCTICSTLMAVGWATSDRVFYKSDGTKMSNAEVKALRELVRKRTGDTEGGTSIEDCVVGIEKTWPFLQLACVHRTMSQIEALWEKGWAGAVQGNPSAAPEGSPLRKWTANDDFGHAIFAGPKESGRAREWVQDPLGFGSYQGQWVPTADIKAFMRPLRRADGTYHTLLYPEDALLSTVTTPKSGEERGFTLIPGESMAVYALNTTTGRYAKAFTKTPVAPEPGRGVEVVVRQYPPGSPSGSFVLVNEATDSRLIGKITKIDNIVWDPETPPPPDAIEAAKAEGYKTGVNDSAAAVEALKV